VVTKYQSAVDLQIITNGNYFYKNTAFLGNKTEYYRSDLSSLPGFFYVPQGLQKVYFTINNSNPGGTGYATPEQINSTFNFKDNYGNSVKAILASPADSSLFYLDIPAGQGGNFWQAFTMEQYNLCFANISNVLLFAKRKPCSKIDFKISINDKNGNCLTHLSAVSNARTTLKWEIYDSQRLMYYGNESEIDLPDYVSPNATVTLFADENCSVTKRIADAPGYAQSKEACANGGPLPVADLSFAIFPNPSSGIYDINFNGIREYVHQLIIYDAQGSIVLRSNNINQVNITRQPAGVYIYRIIFNDSIYTGKLIKL